MVTPTLVLVGDNEFIRVSDWGPANPTYVSMSHS